jgi:hypothetical protein
MTMAKLRFFFLTILLLTLTCGTAMAQAADPCQRCHKDFTKVLPKQHAEVKGGLEQCLACHSTGQTGVAEKNAFSTSIHLQHTAKQKLECTACHTFVDGKSFGLIGQKNSWGAPKGEDLALMKKQMASWSSSSFTDNMHAKANVDCAGCHGKDVPVSDSTVENPRCLACHGPVEKLAAKSANKDFPKRNPHASHYGSDIACTTCHHAHEASVVMCADCHKLWKLEVPGAAK